MNIGLASACFYPDVLTEDSIKIMKDLGFNQGELFLNTYSEYEDEFVLRVKEQCEKHNFSINSVHIFSTMVEPFLFDSYKRRREDMMILFKKICSAIDILEGNKIYTFHGLRKIDNSALNYDIIIDMYNRLTYEAGMHGIKLAQENVSWCMSSDLEYLSILKEKVKYPLYYTLDLKQSYKVGIDPLDYIDIMDNMLCNFHINDKDNYSSCLLPGKGKIDYKKIFKKLSDINYNGMAIIEVYSDNYKSYNELTESKLYLEELIEEVIK